MNAQEKIDNCEREAKLALIYSMRDQLEGHYLEGYNRLLPKIFPNGIEDAPQERLDSFIGLLDRSIDAQSKEAAP